MRNRAMRPASSLPFELDALLERVVDAAEQRDRGILPWPRRRPLLVDRDPFALAEQLVLDRLGEDAPLGPPPHFAADGVDDDEVVGLAAGEGELDALAGGVGDAELEVNRVLLLGDVELRRQLDGFVLESFLTSACRSDAGTADRGEREALLTDDRRGVRCVAGCTGTARIGQRDDQEQRGCETGFHGPGRAGTMTIGGRRRSQIVLWRPYQLRDDQSP